MKSVKMKFVNRLLFIFLPPLLSVGAILVMMWNYAGWWDCSHYDCMLDELHLHHMRVTGDECINKSPEDFVFIVNSDLSMVWQLSMSKISLEGLLDLCSCEGGGEGHCRARLFSFSRYVGHYSPHLRRLGKNSANASQLTFCPQRQKTISSQKAKSKRELATAIL